MSLQKRSREVSNSEEPGLAGRPGEKSPAGRNGRNNSGTSWWMKFGGRFGIGFGIGFGKGARLTVPTRPFFSFVMIVGALGAGVPSEKAAAGSSSSVFETIGTSTAVGFVLGASTLPFYERPGDHVANLYLGAAAGACVGLGILVFRGFGGSSEKAGVHPGLDSVAIRKPELGGFAEASLDSQKENLSRHWIDGAELAHASGAEGSSDKNKNSRLKVWLPLVSLTM